MNLLVIIYGLVFSALWGAGFLYLVLIYSNARKSLKWPQVAGEIVQSELKFSGKADVFALVVYQFEVDENVFHGDQIGLDFISLDKRTADRILQKYPVGAEVVVSFDPRDPRYSMLEPGVKKWVFGLAIAMLLFFLLGAFILYQVLVPVEQLEQSIDDPLRQFYSRHLGPWFQ